MSRSIRRLRRYAHRDEVYGDGQPAATAQEYSQQAIALTNTPAQQPPPPEAGQPAEWLPMGVWALAEEEKGDAYMFFQISIDKNGVVTGAYQKVLSGESLRFLGRIKKRSEWPGKIDSNNTVIETGLQNPHSGCHQLPSSLRPRHHADLAVSGIEATGDA
jgi:hypothetical protein